MPRARSRPLFDERTLEALDVCLAVGVIEARRRPDGQLGFYLTPEGLALMEDDA